MCNEHGGQDKHYGSLVIYAWLIFRLVLPVAVVVLGHVAYPKVERDALKLAILASVYAAVRDLFRLWERRPRLWRLFR